jgi:hypothetical protein
MEAAGLRSVAEARQSQVDAVLGRLASLAKTGTGARVRR